METISFAIELDSDYSVVPPEVTVLHDGLIVQEKIPICDLTSLVFSLDIAPGDHFLEILREGHDELNYQLCKIITIQSDGIDITAVTQFGMFFPQYPKQWYQEQLALGEKWPESHMSWKEWGWNGRWKLEYQSPFYTWLLNRI